MYQHGTIADVAKALESGLLKPTTLTSFHMAMCSEEHPDVAKHERDIQELEKEWPRYASRSHHRLSQAPLYLSREADPDQTGSAAPLWRAEAGRTTQAEFAAMVSEAHAEGANFLAAYNEDVQFVLSRTNHHHHKMTKDGRMPLGACRKKGKGNSKICKHGFSKDKEMTVTVKVICKGNAKKHNLKIRGRRNALGSILGKRNCPWLCGTARPLAAVFRSNTNTMPNYRVPLLQCTHDPECGCDCLRDVRSLHKLSLIISKAAKTTTGYFGGYTSKRQPVGKHELAQSARTLNLLAQKIKGRGAYSQFCRVTSRMMTDLYGRGTCRTLPEEFNLTTNMQRQDSTAAEFLRSYQIREFRGSQYLFLLEQALQKESKPGKHFCILPVRPVTQKHRNSEPIRWTTIYGYRGTDERIFSLCPWELWRYWDAVRLEAPCFYEEATFTTWTSAGAAKFARDGLAENAEYQPGVDYEPAAEAPEDGQEYIILPRTSGATQERMEAFRATWILRKSSRPCVLAPTSTPLPHYSHSKEQRARICSVYPGFSDKVTVLLLAVLPLLAAPVEGCCLPALPSLCPAMP